MKKFGEGVTNAQAALARRFEAAGLTSYSQAMKAFQRKENTRIAEWKQQLAAKEASSRICEQPACYTGSRLQAINGAPGNDTADQCPALTL